jgi:hypothetical protein
MRGVSMQKMDKTKASVIGFAIEIILFAALIPVGITLIFGANQTGWDTPTKTNSIKDSFVGRG